MINQSITKTTTVILGALSVMIALTFYTGLSWRQHRINPDDRSIPTWKQMYEGIKYVATPQERSGQVWLKDDLKATGERLGLSMAVSLMVGTFLGMLGCFTTARSFISPLLEFFSQITPTAIIAVFFAFVPIMSKALPITEEYNMYIAIVSFGLVPSLAKRIHLAIRDVPDQLIFKSYTLGASHMEVVTSVIFRQIFPRILDAINALFGPAMVYLIASEMLCANAGFGYRIRLQARLGNMDIVFPYIIILALFGFTVTNGLKLIQRWTCPWFSNER